MNRKYIVTYVQNGEELEWIPNKVDDIATRLNSVEGVTEVNIKIIEE